MTRPGQPGWRPPLAYVPGQTPRHPEGLFDPIRDTARPGMTADDLRRSLAWREGRHYLDEGFHWEAHEVMEAVWLALPDGPQRLRVQAAIQLANAGLKLRMDRRKAAERLAGIVRDLAQRSEGEVADRWMSRTDLEARLSGYAL